MGALSEESGGAEGKSSPLISLEPSTLKALI